MIIKNIFLISTALLLCAGCFNPFFTNPHFQVKESGLNWIEILSKPIPGETLSRVRIDGSGIVKVRSGTSPLVGDSYAKDPTNTSWFDVYNEQITIPRDEVVRIFQELVNNGLFVEQKQRDDSPTNHFIRVSGNIDNHTVGSIIFDPVLHEHLKSIEMLFNRPRQKRP